MSVSIVLRRVNRDGFFSREQRVTGALVFMMVGLSGFFSSVLKVSVEF